MGPVNPATIALVGAGVGAMMDDEKPLRGAALGAMGGYAGGAAMGAGAAQSGAGMAVMTGGAVNNAMYGALPGLTMSTAPGTQAAMLAAQTAEFGAPGLLATGEALATPGSMTSGAFGAGKNLAFGGQDASNLMKAGNAISQVGGGQPQQRQAPIVGVAPQINPNAGGQFNKPYNPEEEQFSYMFNQPSVLPGFRR